MPDNPLLTSGSLVTYMPDRNSGRQELRGHGALGGKDRAKNDYPTYVYRDRRQIEQLAAEDFQEFAAYRRTFDERKLNEFQNRSNGDWKDIQKKNEQYRAYYRDYESTSWQQIKAEQIGILQNALSRWDSQINAARQEYETAYVIAYLEYIEQEDAKRRPAPKPEPVYTPPQPQPATPSNKATLQGVTITLKRVEHSANECIYYLEVEDPDYIDGTFEDTWTVLLEGATVPETPTATTSASSGTSSAISSGTYASSSSDAYKATRGTPQKPRKVIGSYFRKSQ